MTYCQDKEDQGKKGKGESSGFDEQCSQIEQEIKSNNTKHGLLVFPLFSVIR